MINKGLLLALGVAIGVIIMLLRERAQESNSPTVVGPSVAPSILPAPADPAPREDSPPAQEPALPAEATATTAEDTAAFEQEMKRVLRGEASDDEQLAFWQGIRTSKRLDALIADLKDTAESNPDDVATRLSLAQAYITKLWGAPAGPAQGLWAGKAEVLWKEVLETDPNNWDAQRNIAFSYSQYPDFLNKTGAAIAEYEKTLAIQEAADEPRGRFANSYLELSKLHIKNGDPSSALATLEKGATIHPDNAGLAEQLRVISSSYKFEEPAEE